MRKLFSVATLSAAVGAIVVSAVSAQTDSSVVAYTARVQVTVSSSDDISNRIKSFLTRELREIPGVIVTNMDPNWIISIVAMETKNQIGTVTGYAISYTLLMSFNPETFKELLRLTEDQWPILEFWTANLYYFKDQKLMVGPMDNLKLTCEGIVADFDAHLEIKRQLRQTLDATKKKKQ